ncbi:hypothetical protein Bca52824_012198 [Brassica carinata]|uniref:Uncharacterized protein n=1 Tax=Brassica carinata TaxID=52824 RepID=A0A8X8B1A2_BRACI|nr:hypothetical protein Bca52824_012198 [Brassica carinata]
MDRVRPQFLNRFDNMVREMLCDHRFVKGECIPTIIAETIFTQMNAGAVVKQIIKSYSTIAYFNHKSPQQCLQNQDMACLKMRTSSTTRLLITTKSAFI